MLKSKHAVIAAAVFAAWSALPASGESTSVRGAGGPNEVKEHQQPEERASAVIRSIDTRKPSAAPVPIDTAELLRARAAGELTVPERGEPAVVELIQIDDPVRPAEKPRAITVVTSPAAAQAEVKGEARPQAQVVRVDASSQVVRPVNEAKDRTKTQAVVRLDDAARYREAAKYEAEKKRRTEAAKTAAISEEAKPRSQQANTQAQTQVQTKAQTTAEPAVTVMGTAQGRAEISWSAPAQPDPPVVIVVESPDANPKN